jgi:fumarate hydratase subunit beta
MLQLPYNKYRRMIVEIKLETPLTLNKIKKLKAGDKVLLSGVIYTGRDAAHKRLIEMIKRKETLPLDLENQVIYFVGPSPAKPGEIIGAAGPTTSGRMDAFSPELIKLGLSGMIGKGERSAEVIESMKKYGAIYFGATGGAAALLARSIVYQEIIAFEDLGTEAIRKLIIKDFPVIVIIDLKGNDLYKSGREKYCVLK